MMQEPRSTEYHGSVLRGSYFIALLSILISVSRMCLHIDIAHFCHIHPKIDLRG